MILSPAAQSKGYVLDLTSYKRDEPWTDTIKKGHLMDKKQDITYIVDLSMEDADVKLRGERLRENPVDTVLYSEWQRIELKKPKPKKEGDDDDDNVDDEDDENKPKPLVERELVKIPNDHNQQLNYYNAVEKPAIDELVLRRYDQQYIKLEVAGLSPE